MNEAELGCQKGDSVFVLRRAEVLKSTEAAEYHFRMYNGGTKIEQEKKDE